MEKDKREAVKRAYEAALADAEKKYIEERERLLAMMARDLKGS